jgi:hypothetical protein
MQVFYHKDVSYVHAPKIGSRSILGWFSILKDPEIYTKHPEYFVEVNTMDHAYTPIRRMQQECGEIRTSVSFVVSRDPVKRFVSAYKNRVVTHKELRGSKLIDPSKNYPEFDQFVDQFHQFRDESKSIEVHFKSLTFYYGGDKSLFTRIFRTENLSECRVFLQDHFSTELPDLRLQQNKPGIHIEPTHKQISFIQDLYKQDYLNGWT